jgi:uncharacterized membrane protein YfcA
LKFGSGECGGAIVPPFFMVYFLDSCQQAIAVSLAIAFLVLSGKCIPITMIQDYVYQCVKGCSYWFSLDIIS